MDDNEAPFARLASAAHSSPGRVLLALVFFLACFTWPTWTVSGVPQGDPGEPLLQEGLGLIKQKKYQEAIKVLKRANALRGKRCAECLLALAQAERALEKHKDAVKSCERALESAGEDPQLRLQAHNLKGVCLLALTPWGKEGDKKLREAEAEFRKVIELGPTVYTARYNLGVSLLRQGRDPEGIEALRRYLDRDPQGRWADHANRLIRNPRLARENYAPEFAIVTLGGQSLRLSDLRGKVVLLDFWGTWCPPCVAAVPELRNLQKRYAKDAFVMIAISSDVDEGAWRSFIQGNRMTWPQYLDGDRTLQQLFNVFVFPSYVLIDSDGIVRYRTSGASFGSAAFLDYEIERALKRARKAE